MLWIIMRVDPAVRGSRQRRADAADRLPDTVPDREQATEIRRHNHVGVRTGGASEASNDLTTMSRSGRHGDRLR
jgi:hypothetical protein